MLTNLAAFQPCIVAAQLVWVRVLNLAAVLFLCDMNSHSAAMMSCDNADYMCRTRQLCGALCRNWLAADKAKAIAEEKRRIEEEEANMLVGPELPAGVSQQDMGDYGGALLPGER